MRSSGLTKSRTNEPGKPLDALSGAYADWRGSTLGRITDLLEEQLLLDRIGIVRGLRILDVGCGDGLMVTRLAQNGASVTGFDVSPDMLLAARQRASAAGVEAVMVNGRSDELPFSAERFDIVNSVATLCFVQNAARSVREMARVLKPSGRLILGELAGGNLWAARRRISGWLGSELWGKAHFRGPGELIELAENAGLKDITVTGAIFYPPFGFAARMLAPIDPWLGRRTTLGAAFLVMSARKPCDPQDGKAL